MSTQTLEKPTNSAIDTTYHQELFERIQTLSFKTGNFVLASGKASSFYLDCRKTTLDGRGSFLIGRLCYDILSDLNIDAVGGMSMGADPIVSSITYRSADVGRPIQGFLVRKEAKGHGTGKQVEGHLEAWMRVALVEDVVTTGGSTLKAIEAVERACPGIQIVKILALVDREEGAQEAFAKRSIPFERLYSVQAFLS